jgi:predicted ATPase/DNA-binding SARP family transcriptional activator/class 3 adenylate cyclase
MDLRILGPLEALVGSQPVPLGGRKRRAVLAVLLLHANETLSSERLIDELWGESPPANALKTLQVHVSRLRKALPADVLMTRGHGYELRLGPDDLDAGRFERLLEQGRDALAAERPGEALPLLERALALWRGPPLADLAYEPFAQTEIARLEDLRVATVEQLIDAKLALGRHAEVIAELERLVDEHPYRERLRAQLMLALYRAERQADALQAYQNARRRLVEELGIEPGERLRELESAVLAQDPSLALPIPEPEEPPEPEPEPEPAAEPEPEAPAGLPSGVVTFLLTDIERSSALWEVDPDAMAAALEFHDELIARTVEAHDGRLLKTKGEGDSTLTVFPRASDAIACAAALRTALGAVAWPADLDLRVRIALHTGEAHERDGDYFGPALNRAARLRALADGGVTLLSQATKEIVHDRLPAGTELADLGTHELRDLSRPERVFELREAGTGGTEGLPAAPREIRKTVTVLFAEIGEPADRRATLDAEARRRVSSHALAAARTVLERHGATVQDCPGDVLMAVFGIPLLHEDDALRAVRAAVELRHAVPASAGELGPALSIQLATCSGIATGEVIADRGARTELPEGQTINAAKHLQELAEAGEVLIDEATLRLIRDSVTAGPAPLDRVGDGEDAYVLGALRAEPDRHGGRESPLVGRTRQMHALSGAFDAAVSDRVCHLVTVLGPAGVGKSRLVDEFTAGLSGRATVLRGRCLSYGEGITYWPLSELVRDLAGSDPAAEVGEALRDELAGDPQAEVIADVLAEAIGLGGTGGQATEKIFWSARRLFEMLAHRHPLVVVVDDLQWAEPTFLDLVEHVADLARDAPMVLLCLARPELLDARSGWAGGKLNASSILLEPLPPAESRELVDNLVEALAPDASARIGAACEGHPLFAEELIAMLIEDGQLRRGDEGRWSLVDAPSVLPVPPTIQALLGARVDRLPDDERALLTHVSVEGDVFHREAMRALAPPALAPVVDRTLTSLIRRDVIRPDRASFGDDEAFRFRHILIRDAAYRSLPKETRAQLHERFADWLEDAAGERVHEFEEIVGYHLEQAHRFRGELGETGSATEALAARAHRWLESAGRRATRRSDRAAAVTLLERAAALTSGDTAHRAALLADLGGAQIEAGRLADAGSVLAEAIRVAEAAGDERAAARALIHREFLRLQLGEAGGNADAYALVERVIPVFRESGDEQGLCTALRLRAWLNWIEGLTEPAALAWEVAAGHARSAGLEHERIEILGWIASSLFWGPAPVGAAIERCEAIRHEVEGHLVAMADVLQPLAGLHAMEGRFDEARRLLAASDAAFQELGLSLSTAVSHHAAEVEMLAGDPVAAERWLRKGYAALEEMGEQALLSTTAAYLGQALLAQGRDEEAERLAEMSSELTGDDDVITQAMGRGVRATVLARRGELAEAESLARQALSLAERTDFLTAIAEAQLVLADVLAGSGRHDEANAARKEALELYERKGNIVAAEQVRGDLAPSAPV